VRAEGGNAGGEAESEAAQTAAAAREALTFFFSEDGEIFRGFLLDEVTLAADALSREALGQLVATPAARALDLLPAPSGIKSVNRALLGALSPPLTESDQATVDSIRKLLAFFAGDLDLTPADASAANAASNEPAVLRSLAPDPAALAKARALLPVLQENQAEMRKFGFAIVGRLSELQANRAIGFLRDRVAAI